MKKLIAILLTLCLLTGSCAMADAAFGQLRQPIATRSGPGTEYFEPGTFLSRGDYVTVHTKVWDAVNEIWWVQVEFTEYGETYRAYTGAWRMSVDLRSVPEEVPLTTCTVIRDADVFAGPGWDYVMWNDTVWRGTSATLLEVENGYGLIECWNDSWRQMWRVWAPLSCLNCWDWFTSHDDTYPLTGGSFNRGSFPVGRTCWINVDNGNARTGAGTEYPIVDMVYCGESYTVLDTARAANGVTWYMIHTRNGYCWISSGLTNYGKH